MPPRQASSEISKEYRSWSSLTAILGLAFSLSAFGLPHPLIRAADSSPIESDLQIDIAKIGLGKEVVITHGRKEWFMRVEVTPENSVVVRQEKDGDRYLLDESEMHDRSMTPAEVETAITDFINSVKTRQNAK
ncbi:MAG TPA: hypothetical protein VM842_08150 [Nitrospira sp.]|jgi:hypothetical protein|nr:hypothetical protein [Nitrospira sp.]